MFEVFLTTADQLGAYLGNIKVDLVWVVDDHFIVSFEVHHTTFVEVGTAVGHLLEGALTKKTKEFHLHRVQPVFNLQTRVKLKPSPWIYENGIKNLNWYIQYIS